MAVVDSSNIENIKAVNLSGYTLEDTNKYIRRK